MVNCPEIQIVWKPRNGDFCWHDNEGDDCGGLYEFPAENGIVVIDGKKPQDWWFNWMWLPRQDQLQEMYNGKDLEWTFWDFVTFVDEGEHDYTIEFSSYAKSFNSMEQIWLAFVMKEKYNKVWSGEDWEEVKNG